MTPFPGATRARRANSGRLYFVRRRVKNDTFARKVTPGGLDFVRRRFTKVTFARKVTLGRLDLVRRVTNDTCCSESDAHF